MNSINYISLVTVVDFIGGIIHPVLTESVKISDEDHECVQSFTLISDLVHVVRFELMSRVTENIRFKP